MGIRAWFPRSDSNQPAGPPAGKRRGSAVRRQNEAKGVRPRAQPHPHPHKSREEPYNSEFITRYGDPFD
jgi:hypothetical protein